MTDNQDNLAKAFKCAFRGIKIGLTEQTFRIFIAISIAVLSLMFYLRLPLNQKAILILVIVFVLGLELLNSQIERVCDFVCPETDGEIRAIKDISAGAVLLSSIGAAIIGILILGPPLIEILLS